MSAPLLQERGIFGFFRKQTVLGGELSLGQHKLFGCNTISSTLSGKRMEFLAETFPLNLTRMRIKRGINAAGTKKNK